MSMRLCSGFQRVGSPMILNFPAYLNTHMIGAMAKIKNKGRIPFKFYSLLMHLLLFKNKDYLLEVIDLQLERVA